jgi:hypothetical protein
MKKYILFIAIFFTIGISACKKNYLDLEVNPNSPSVTTPQLTLAGALVTAVSIVNGLNSEYANDGVWMGYWTQSGNFVPSPSLQQFNITTTSFTGVWTELYTNLTNFNNLQTTSAKDPTLGNFQAIAMIMKAYDFEQLVDQFGDVPYSQAFQPSTILFPAYDSGQAIYNDLVKQLDAAIALINKSTGATNPSTSDVAFGGNMTGWKKFANTIKLRLAIRQSTKSPTNAASSDLASTAGEGYLDDKTQAVVNPGYSNTLSSGFSQQSPFYASYGFLTTGNPTGNNTFYRAGSFLVSLLNTDNDPRINQVFALTLPVGAPASATPSVIKGNIFGDTQNSTTNSNTSAIGAGLLQSPTQNAVLLSGAEACFLQAEALLDGYSITAGASFATAQLAYQAGITASFVALGLTAAQATTYYSQNIPNVGWAASTNKEEAIIYQKYISLVGYSNLEAYLEYERTGYPVLPNPVSIDPAAVSTTLPVRQYYPLSELTSNGTNLAKEGTINIFTSKLFWEQ